MIDARDHLRTLDLANAFDSPGVNSRGELVPSARTDARNGAPRRWLGDKSLHGMSPSSSQLQHYWTLRAQRILGVTLPNFQSRKPRKC